MNLFSTLPTLARVILALIAAMILSLLVSAPAITLARKIKLMDIPGASPHKQHLAPTPLAGGLILITSLAILMSIFDLWHNSTSLIFVAALIIFIFGLLDDRYGFSAAQKFSGQLAASLLLLWGGISINIFDAFAPHAIAVWLNGGLTIFWLIGIINAYNLTDSMDGLASGLAVIAAAFFTVFSLASHQTDLALLSGLIFGISIGLYAINVTPAHSFLGDSGAQTLGFLLAAIGILYTPPSAPQGSTWFVPILLVAVPIFDTCLVTFSRLRRRKPVFQADLGHSYHRLVRAGLSPNQAVTCLQLAAFLLGNLAYIAIFLPPQQASVLFGFLCLIGLLILVSMELKMGITE